MNARTTRRAIDEITALYRKYGSIESVSINTGLSPALIREFVFFEKLPHSLKKDVEEGRMLLENAVKATDALNWDTGTGGDSKVHELAQELDRIPSSEGKILLSLVRSDPSASISELTKKLNSRKITKKFVIVLDKANEIDLTIDEKLNKRIIALAKKQNKPPEDIVLNMLIELDEGLYDRMLTLAKQRNRSAEFFIQEKLTEALMKLNINKSSSKI